MAYAGLKTLLLELLKAPQGPPEPPYGSPGSVEIFRASPAFLRLKLGLNFVSIGAALAFELLGLALPPSPGGRVASTLLSGALVVSTLIVMVVRHFLIRLDYDMRYYVLTDRSLRIRRGAMTIEESTYTFANVQNISLRQGPLERLLRVTNLHVETAGGGSADAAAEAGRGGMYHRGRLEGIDPDTAQRLRDRIRRLVARYQGAGLGDDLGASDDGSRRGPGLSDAQRQRLRSILLELRAARVAATRGE
jgi:membrane protein YdbS with pleckstrin-like domain